MKKTILIAGATGFLGSSLMRHLAEHDSSWRAFGLCRKVRKDHEDFLVCDLNAVGKLKSLLADLRPDIIFNLTGGRIQDIQQLSTDNIQATQSLFEAVRSLDGYRPRIIIPGTAAEYGRISSSTKPVTENYPARPLSLYGFVKLMQTQLSLFYAAKGMDIVVARMFNIIGYGTPESLALGRFASQVAAIEQGRQEPRLKTGGLDGLRDFLDIQDVCRALITIAKKGRSGMIYNVCSSRAYSVREVLQRMLTFSKVRSIKVQEESGNRQESFDIKGSYARLKKATGWLPQVSLDDSLAATLKYYRQTNQIYAHSDRS